MAKIDKQRIREAIRQAERRTSGEICVSLAPPFWGSVWKAAEMAFDRLGMKATRDRNAVLLFVVPSRHRFVVFGDRGIDEKVSPQFWLAIASAMTARFAEGDLTGGIVAGVEAVGEELARSFPHLETDVNELPDTVDDQRRR